ncbi:MAG: velvet factor [Benjaminiella poitrasii]|nr:MAG: velvet factor [Benjaminiella poitrasii]
MLEVVEQPFQCRMAGIGDKDRRPIDPAPIVKLTILDEQDIMEDISIECPFYLLHATLWSIDMKTQYDLINSTTSGVSLRILIGSLVSSPSLLKDLDNRRAYYFAFPDLSVRTTGQYRLQFSLVHLTRNKTISETFSEPFTVYTAKAYPGMKESSQLSRHLAKQGLKLTIRTQTRSKRK